MGQMFSKKNLSPEEKAALEAENAEIKKKMDKLFEEELEKTSQPMFITKAFVNKPFHVLGVISIFFLIGIILTATAKLFELSDDHDRDYLIWSNERTKDWDIYEEMVLDFQKSKSNSQTPERSVSMDDWFTFIIVTCEDLDDCDNVITPAAIKIMYETEQKFRGHKDYEKFCLTTTTNANECAADSFFSITKQDQDFPDPSNVTKEQINNFLDKIVNDDDKWLQFKGFFHEDLSRNNKKAKAIRSMLRFGAPIKVDDKLKKDVFDDEEGQEDVFEEFSKDLIDIFRDEIKTSGDLQVIGWSGIIRVLEQQRIVNTDFLWAFGSITFVWFYITFTLKSLFLGSLSIFSIVMSFPLTQIIVKLIFQIKYFSSLHILVVFIVLGISADNVFVFTDAWNQSEFYKSLEGDYDKRMAVTFRRASKAILATSSTTGAAFLATGLSTIMPISSFGFFAGILIPINFVLVITFYPALLILYTKYTKNMCTFNSCRKTSPEKQVVEKEKQQPADTENQQNGEEQKKEELNMNQKIEQFFEGPFNDFTQRFGIPVMIIFAIWTSIAAWRTTQLPALSKPMAFLPDDFDTQKASNLLREEFHTSGDTDNGIKVYQYWGAKSINQDDVGTWDSSDRGKIEYDDTFTLAPTENQEFLLNYCKDMRDKNVLGLVQDKRVECFIEDFQEWADTVDLVKFPVSEDQFFDKLKEFIKHPLGEKHFIENRIGIIGDKLKYVYIEMASIGTPFASHSTLNPIYEKWDNHIKATNRSAPAGMQKSRQTALINWVLMITEKAFVSNAIQGTLISITFAFAVLILTTHNIVTSLFSTISIIGIILSVISIMEMNGWELGVAESIAIVILIGMSVDYVVHLANHYVESMFPDKHRKMQMSLKDLGISIISGAFTTIGSGIFLFFATMIIFNKFALLIVVTILFSLSYALIFFSSLNHLIGPQGNTGNLLVLFKKKDKNNGKDGDKQTTEKSNESPGSKNNLVNDEKQKYIDEQQQQKQQEQEQGQTAQAQAQPEQQPEQQPTQNKGKGTEVEDIEQQ